MSYGKIELMKTAYGAAKLAELAQSRRKDEVIPRRIYGLLKCAKKSAAKQQGRFPGKKDLSLTGRMKKFSSILLIGLFLLLQANRFTAYLGCQLKNQYSAMNCDCEKIFSSPAEDPAGHQQLHTHWPPDDFFFPAEMAVIKCSEENNNYREPAVSRRLPGFLPGLEHPPAA